MKRSLSCQTGIQTVGCHKHPDDLPPDDWFAILRKLLNQLEVVLKGAKTDLTKSPGVVQQPELVGWWERAEALCQGTESLACVLAPVVPGLTGVDLYGRRSFHRGQEGRPACKQPRGGPSPRPDRRRGYRCVPDLFLQSALIDGEASRLEAECCADPICLCAFNRDQGHA